ncbi:hypothetical protein [Lysobacter sp. CA199]|uniref:hypothetical protein n=1 Tax=Lysobacter sp. CA199 TaxID=3455608 RepID=UPI003F8D5898
MNRDITPGAAYRFEHFRVSDGGGLSLPKGTAPEFVQLVNRAWRSSPTPAARSLDWWGVLAEFASYAARWGRAMYRVVRSPTGDERLRFFWDEADQAAFLRTHPGTELRPHQPQALFTPVGAVHELQAFLTTWDGEANRHPWKDALPEGFEGVTYEDVLTAFALHLIHEALPCPATGWWPDHAVNGLVQAGLALAIAEYWRGHNGREEAVSDEAATRARRRWEPLGPVKARALELYQSRKWPSAWACAGSIAPELVEMSRAVGLPLSPENARRTVYGWIKPPRRSPPSMLAAGSR